MFWKMVHAKVFAFSPFPRSRITKCTQYAAKNASNSNSKFKQHRQQKEKSYSILVAENKILDHTSSLNGCSIHFTAYLIFAFHHETGFGELCIHYEVNFYLPMKRSWKCCIISISLTNGRYNGCIEKKKTGLDRCTNKKIRQKDQSGSYSDYAEFYPS